MGVAKWALPHLEHALRRVLSSVRSALRAVGWADEGVDFRPADAPAVMPAKAGILKPAVVLVRLDPRFRGDDEIEGFCVKPTTSDGRATVSLSIMPISFTSKPYIES